MAHEQHTWVRPPAGVAWTEQRRRPRVPVMIGVGDPLVATAFARPSVRRPERIADEGSVARGRVRGPGRGHGRALLEDAQPFGRGALVVEICLVPPGGARNRIPEPAGAIQGGGISPVRRGSHRQAGRRHRRRQQQRDPHRTAAANDHGSSPETPQNSCDRFPGLRSVAPLHIFDHRDQQRSSAVARSVNKARIAPWTSGPKTAGPCADRCERLTCRSSTSRAEFLQFVTPSGGSRNPPLTASACRLPPRRDELPVVLVERGELGRAIRNGGAEEDRRMPGRGRCRQARRLVHRPVVSVRLPPCCRSRPW